MCYPGAHRRGGAWRPRRRGGEGGSSGPSCWPSSSSSSAPTTTASPPQRPLPPRTCSPSKSGSSRTWRTSGAIERDASFPRRVSHGKRSDRADGGALPGAGGGALHPAGHRPCGRDGRPPRPGDPWTASSAVSRRCSNAGTPCETTWRSSWRASWPPSSRRPGSGAAPGCSRPSSRPSTFGST